MNCGLLGKSLAHSYSPQIHRHLGKYSYQIFEKQPQEIAEFLQTADYTGLNVTIPYKKDVIPYCSELTDCARRMGAVNTIVRRPDGKLIGHNTDYFGFLFTVKRMGLSVKGKKVLVLGSGGASLTAVANAIACRLSTEELTLLGVVLTQLGDTLTTIAVGREVCEKRK